MFTRIFPRAGYVILHENLINIRNLSLQNSRIRNKTQDFFLRGILMVLIQTWN